jgi:hypothetical protein
MLHYSAETQQKRVIPYTNSRNHVDLFLFYSLVGREYRSSSVSYSEDAKVELFLLEVDIFDYTRPVQLSWVEYHTTDALLSNLDPA